MRSKAERDEAENDLLDIVRRNDVQNFSVRILCSKGRWNCRVVNYDATHVEAEAMEGEGQSFTEAWQAMQPKWAKG